jgi:hypothetical protein
MLVTLIITWSPQMDVRDATPEEQKQWFEDDFFMKGDFDVMQMFVVIPAVIQIVVFGMMLAVMLVNSYIF